jgi:sterol 3beta-glucosyltransferase
VGALIKPSDPPTLSSLFTDAAKFHKVLASSHCIDESPGSDSEGSNGFAALVGRDLDSSEQAAAANVARLRATRYSWGSTELSSESESYDQNNILAESEEQGKLLERQSVTTAETEEGDFDKLEPAQIIDILIKEFGPLASDDEKEGLILELDGCMICQDVFIVV